MTTLAAEQGALFQLPVIEALDQPRLPIESEVGQAVGEMVLSVLPNWPDSYQPTLGPAVEVPVINSYAGCTASNRFL